jgi:hypothetical protein
MNTYQPTRKQEADITTWMINPENYREELEEIRRAELIIELERLKIRSRGQERIKK